MLYLFAKALHVVGFVSWFAGLLYVVRLFVYDVEAAARPDEERRILHAELHLMERRLWYGITWPAMGLTFAAGAWMLVRLFVETGGLPTWLWIKLVLLAGLVGYHVQCGRLRVALEREACRWTSRQLRAWNELATLLLVAIVFTAVFRSSLGVVWGLLGLIVLAAALMAGVRIYERARRNPDASAFR